MKKYLLSALMGILAIAVAVPAGVQAQQREAFPGAEGYGRLTTGGRGGKVYHVTNLDDSGAGSFRAAVEASGTRTIVFDVSGTIYLKSQLKLRNGNVTIAGQTAPGDGVCIADFPLEISADNVIIRFMRFRPGNRYVNNSNDGWDGLGAIDRKWIIVDHCSVSWSIDECLSFVGCENTTVQWCIVSQSLVNAGHSKGAHGYGGNWGGAKSSYHHNLLSHHTSRCPRLGPRYTTQDREQVDIRNNVFFNYTGESCYGGEAQHANIVHNYYKPGPGNAYVSNSTNAKGSRIAAIGIRTNKYIEEYPVYAPTLHVVGKYYVSDNMNYNRADVRKDNWANGMYNQITWSEWDDVADTAAKQEQVKKDMKLDVPVEFTYTTTHDPDVARQRILKYAGASLKYDALDTQIITDASKNTVKWTGSGQRSGFINTQNDVKYTDGTTGWPTLASAPAPTDSDGDGIPDSWENANGLNPNDPADGAVKTADGYTNLEHYLNSLVAHIVSAQNESGKLLHGQMVLTDEATTLPEYDPTAPDPITSNPSNPGGDDPEEEDPFGDDLMLADTNGTGEVYTTSMTDLYSGSAVEFSATASNSRLNKYTWPCGASMTLVKDDKAYGGGNTNTSASKAGMNKPVKLSNGAPNCLVLPEGFTTDRIIFYGYCNTEGESAWISDISLEKDGALESLYTGSSEKSIPYQAKADWEPLEYVSGMNSIECNLGREVGGTLWFKNGGKQPAFYIRVCKAGSSAIDTIGADAAARRADNRIFNLMGQEVKGNLAPGIYIRNGRKFLVR